MSSSERSYAFMLNKAALKSANILIKTRFQVFGDKIGTASLMGILQAPCANHSATYMWNDTTTFRVLSYHGLNCRIIVATTLPGGDLYATWKGRPIPPGDPKVFNMPK
jgi:hypothetical protein